MAGENKVMNLSFILPPTPCLLLCDITLLGTTLASLHAKKSRLLVGEEVLPYYYPYPRYFCCVVLSLLVERTTVPSESEVFILYNAVSLLW